MQNTDHRKLFDHWLVIVGRCRADAKDYKAHHSSVVQVFIYKRLWQYHDQCRKMKDIMQICVTPKLKKKAVGLDILHGKQNTCYPLGLFPPLAG